MALRRQVGSTKILNFDRWNGAVIEKVTGFGTRCATEFMHAADPKLGLYSETWNWTQGHWRSRLPFIIVDPTSKVSARAFLTKEWKSSDCDIFMVKSGWWRFFDESRTHFEVRRAKTISPLLPMLYLHLILSFPKWFGTGNYKDFQV